MADPVSESLAGGAGTAFDYRAVLRQMLEQNASDLHLKVGCAPTLRVNGELINLPMAPMRSDDMKALADQIMPPKRQKEFGEM
jgi:twitching motility protein PilT